MPTGVGSEQLVIDKEWNVKFKNVKYILKKPRKKEFTDSFQKFEHCRIITKEQFYDELNMKQISIQKFSQYLTVWNSIFYVNLGKYSDLYLKIDVFSIT